MDNDQMTAEIKTFIEMANNRVIIGVLMEHYESYQDDEGYDIKIHNDDIRDVVFFDIAKLLESDFSYYVIHLIYDQLIKGVTYMEASMKWSYLDTLDSFVIEKDVDPSEVHSVMSLKVIGW